MMNPLLNIPYPTLHHTPPFHLIEVTDFKPAIETALRNGREEIRSIIESTEHPSFGNTIEALEDSGKMLGLISNILFNLNHAHTNEEIQQLARDVSPWLTEYSNDIWLSEPLFNKVKKIHTEMDRSELNKEQIQLLENTYKAFVRRGALLSHNDKQRYREISKELTDRSLLFGENVLSETNGFKLHITEESQLAGLPEYLIQQAGSRAKEDNMNGWIFTLHFPVYLPFMKYAANRDLRRQMFLAYASRGNHDNAHHNRKIIEKIVALRLEKARLLGYSTYADYVLEERMAKSKTAVFLFLNEMLDASLPFAHKELAEVDKLAQSDCLEDGLQKWDFAYYSEKLKSLKYQVDDQITKPYFQLEKVEKGVFDLANRLYGLTFIENASIPVYHPEVKAYEVFDENQKILSVLFLDYFPRPSKQGGAWMTSFRDQYRKGEINIRPVISLVMNFTRPTDQQPSLLTYQEVRTFLHEFGHALHGMLSQVSYESLSGTNVYRDFVELPSQFMENWADEKEWLNSFACHFQTGEPIPGELIDKLIDSANFQSGYATVRQLGFALIDMAWHSLTHFNDVDISSFEKVALGPTDLFPPIEGSSISTAFSHIFDGGYAAGYYGYKWAEVLDADAFETFRNKGIFDKETALSFRKNILEKGGSEHPMDLYKAFRGKEPSIHALLKRSGLTRKL